jgi:serine/threonine-protein kinase
MASVHFGRLLGHAGFSRIVAIKRLLPHVARDPDFVSMFIDEARLAARIRHPNVVPIVDVEAVAGELLLVMEYVHGETLSRLVRTLRTKGMATPLPVAATIFSNILHGLHAAHEAHDARGRPLGIVHRDVSPQNVLVGADGVARVVDFGVAKAVGRLQTTREGQIKGKLAYMAPEQITSTGDRRMDVYAASVVLWETLTGARLFDGENDGAIMHQVLNREVPPPSAHVRDLPSAWDDIVLQGLARDPAARFPTTRAMALAIEHETTMARPSEVGDWVAANAKEALLRRTAQMERLDRTSDSRILTRVSAPTRVERRPDPGPEDATTELVSAGVDSDGASPPRMSWLARVSERPIATTLRSRGGRAAAGGALATALVVTAVFLGRPGGPRPEATPNGSAVAAAARVAVAGTVSVAAASAASVAAAVAAADPAAAEPAASAPPSAQPDASTLATEVRAAQPLRRGPLHRTIAPVNGERVEPAPRKQVSLGTLLDSPN